MLLCQDLVNKLKNLMWFDWHTEVRKAAAQTLGKTGNGKEVHDDLIVKVTQGNEKTRVEAVAKIGHLGIMTARLMPVFLQVSVVFLQASFTHTSLSAG